MTRIRNVGGKIIERTGGKEISYAKESIVFNAKGAISFTAEDGISFGEPQNPSVSKNSDFDIDFEFDKGEKTVVPFGILDFENKIENPFFSFKYTLKKSNVDSLNFKILDEKNEIIYQMGYLKPVIIQAKKKPFVLFEVKKPKEGPLISKTWDYLKMYEPYILSEPDYTKMGEYHLNWDGFDNNEIYDSTRFAGKKLKAQITATKGNKVKIKEIEFEASYKEVDWVDIKIDRKAKRIDVTLRVNLIDGGTKGLDCSTYAIDEEMSYETFTPTNGIDPLKGKKITTCDWDKIPTSEINPSHPVIKSRTRSFIDLEKLAIEGLNYHWGRNNKHAEGKNVNINGDLFEIYITTLNTSINSMVTIDLIYNTNNDWGRSGNPGVFGRIYFNEGYLKYSNGWGFNNSLNAELEYKHTSGHEIGHSILKAYGGRIYSWQHKGTSYLFPQDEKPVKGDESFWDNFKTDNMPNVYGEYYPKTGEIDLMKYYNYELDKISGRRIFVSKIEERSIATERDLMMLLWLTKLEIS